MQNIAVLPSRVAYADPAAAARAITHGQGPYLFDRAGARLFDAACGSGSVILGHGDVEVVRVLADQAQRLTVFPGAGLGCEVVERYAADLVASLCPAGNGRAITFSSGSDAVEAAIKLVIQYHRLRGAPARTTIIGRAASYHGNTLAALSAGGFIARRAPFERMLTATAKAAAAHCPACVFGREPSSCAVECADSVEQAILEAGPANVAAFIAEPIVGAALSAGVPDDRYFSRVRAICDRYDVLLVADEVMTGFGRTGRLLALEHWGVAADVVVTGKAMSAGYLPLSGVIASERVAEAFSRTSEVFQNGQTYCCSPLASAVGQYVLDRIRCDDLAANAAARGAELLDGLRQRVAGESIRNVRGRGLMIGFDFGLPSASTLPPATLARAAHRIAMGHGLLIYPSGGSPRSVDGAHAMLLPPLNITASDVELIVAKLERTATDLIDWARTAS